MKRNIRNAALMTLSAFLFLETAAGYPAVAFAAEEEMAASFSVSEESQEEAVSTSEETAQDEEAATDSAGTSGEPEDSAVNEENGADESAGENETSDPSREEAASDGDSSFDEEGASLASSEELSGEISEEDLIIEEETYEDKLMNRDHASGYCGDDVTWEYDKAQGLLTISGNGAMYDYSEDSPAPWSRYVNFITNVEVCEGVTHLGAYSFWTDETKRMKSTVASVFDEEEEDLPPSYTESEGLFRFSKVTLPKKSLVSIGEAAFANIYLDDYCTVTIPETVTELPRRAFYRLDGDYYDSAVVLPDSIKIIGEECFADAQFGVDVNMPQKVEIIKDSAFRHNVYFEELRFPATLKEIRTKAFLGQKSLHDVWFEGDAPLIGEKAFISTECNAFYPKGNKTFTSEKQKILGKTFKAVCWKEYDGKVAQQVTSGKAGANITFTVDNGNLKFEGTGAMYDYTSDKIPDWAFSKYNNISIDSRITSVGDYCFFHVEARTIDTFPTRLSRVGKYAFCYFKGKFKDNSRTVNIEKVEDNAFRNVDFRHQNSTLVRLEGATYLGKSAFSRSIGCGPAVDISKVTYFGDYALFTGDIVEGSSFSDKVTYIGDGAFLSTRCTGKLKVKLPATLTYLGADVFNYCPYLESEAEIDGKDIKLATGVFEDTPVTSVILGTGVKTIAQNAFDFGSSSTEIKIKFLGDKPEFIINTPTDYGDGIIRCYYPAGNTTWTGIREGHKWDSDAHKYDDIKYIPYGNVTVRFHNAKGEISATSSFPADQTVKEPSVDKRGITSGQEFLGWFTEKDVFNDATRWDFSKPVPYTMDLYAGVGKETCTLKIDYGSFADAEEMTFEKGADIMDVLYEKRDSVSCPDRIIESWYQDKERKKSIYGTFRIQEDTIVYADWSDEGLYLNLDYCYGGKPGEVYRKFVEYGTDIKVNYRQDFFRGWYKDSAYTGEPVANRIQKGDLEPETFLYAKWEIHDSAKIKVTGFDYSVAYTGAAITFPNLTVSDGDRVLTLGKDYTVKYKNNKNIGTAQIILTFKGDYTGTRTENFYIQTRSLYSMKASGQVVVDDNNGHLVANGKYQKLKPRIYEKRGDKYVVLKENKDYVITYCNADPKKTDYNPDAFKAPGKYTMYIDGINTYSGHLTHWITIDDAQGIKSIADLKVDKVKDTTLDEYGNLIRPGINIYDGKKRLEEGVHYSLSFDSKAAIGVNRVKVIGNSKNGYVGSRYLFFNVKACPINKTVITGFESKLPYIGGDPVEQENLAVYRDKASAKKGGAEGRLVKDRDYTVTYRNNICPGKATMIITGTDKVLTGTITRTFTISGESITKAKVEGIENKTYNGSAVVQDNLKLFFRKNAKADKIYLENSMEETAFNNMADIPQKRAVSWTYRYDKNDTVGTATITIKGVNGYTGTLKKTFKISALSKDTAAGAFAMKVAGRVSYTKGSTCPKPVVTFRGKTLTEGKDYKLSYKNNKKIGQTATVTATLIGRFKGTLSDTFEIVRGDLSGCRVEANDIDSMSYKKNRKPKVTVYDTNGVKLTPGTDYGTDFEYLMKGVEFDPDAEKGYRYGDVDLVIYGKGCYAGTEVKGSFRYGGTMLPDCRLRLTTQNSEDVYKEYTGAPVEFMKSDIRVEIKGSKGQYHSIGDENYDIIGYKNNVNVGTATMIIRGKGAYCGTIEIKFRITKKKVK
ncbi:MAG: hypothetical protein E7307_13415 [Butyrivibrio sp.]|nr:hypothetical protein [Butyrivibrio sp.]